MSPETWQNQATIPSFAPGHMYGRWGEDPNGKPRKISLDDVGNIARKWVLEATETYLCTQPPGN